MGEMDFRSTVLVAPGEQHDAILEAGVDAFVRMHCPRATRKHPYLLVPTKEMPAGWVIITDQNLDRFTFTACMGLS